MFDDLAALFHENVVGALNNYLRVKKSRTAGTSRDMRAALAAATALYHFREHLPQHASKTRAAIAAVCPDYDLLGDVVNASKHQKVTRGRKPQIDSADQIKEWIAITDYEDKRGTYRGVEKVVLITLLDGSTRDLLDVLVNVMNYWQNELSALGVIKKTKKYAGIDLTKPRSRRECGTSRLNLKAIQGVRLAQHLQLMKYNYAIGKAEPIDSTGMKARLRIYKPDYEIDVMLRDDRTGKEIKRKIALTEAESMKFHRLRTDAAKQRFLSALPAARAALFDIQKEFASLRTTEAE